MPVLAAAALLAALAGNHGQPATPIGNDVEWTTPSRDESGSMPIGNGDLAANVWVEPDGTILFYVAKSDSWDDNARLLKLGRIRLHVEPNPDDRMDHFVQRLRLDDGLIAIEMGQGEERVDLTIRVDANRPALVVEASSASPTTFVATLDPWRTAKRTIKDVTWSDVFCTDWGSPPRFPMVTEPDTFPPPTTGPLGGEIVSFHHNTRTPIPQTFALQAIEPLLASFHDPILDRTFGMLMTGPGLATVGERTLRSSQPTTTHRFEVWALTEEEPVPERYVEHLAALAHRHAGDDPAAALEAHRLWWQRFWDRSWIRIAENSEARSYPLVDNPLPVAIGHDQNGGNAFKGSIERVLMADRPFGEAELADVATNPDATPAGTRLVWRGGDQPSVEDAPALDGVGGLTVMAWIVPEKQDPGGGRIADKCAVGSADGWMLDTYPSNSLRFIAGESPATVDARLEPGKRVFVAGTYDARTGQKRLYLDGRRVAETPAKSLGAEILNRAYALQRFMSACAGRGAYPIKFNGSLFTVGHPGHDEGDPDYRRWGPGYWFQNTRLAYWPMFASGDIDLTEAFFRLYRDALPLLQAVHRLRHGDRLAPGSAAFHETIYFWGLPDNSSFGWNREGLAAGEVGNPYIRHYRSSSIELLTMGLERYRYAPDERFLKETLLPLADAILAFYGTFFPRNPDGTIRFEPAASLETWHDATDPLPEIAGLRTLLAGLLALDPRLLGEERRTTWGELFALLPPVPLTDAPQGQRIAPARRYEKLANVENPELYAVFPYRLFGVGHPDLDIALRSFALRANRANVGWCQDSIQAAYLGLADEAASLVLRRAALKDAKSRFPAFWGPNYDWVPDQDHGSNILTTLQAMLLQCSGQRILLLPAWPRGWDCDFRLHASGNTTLTGRVRDGRLEQLEVDPPERVEDIELWNTPARSTP